jgi:hypothetical protein
MWEKRREVWRALVEAYKELYRLWKRQDNSGWS